MKKQNPNKILDYHKKKEQPLKAQKKKKLDTKQDKALLEKLKVPIYSPRSTYQQIREKDDLLLQELIFFLEPFTVSVLANDFEELGSEVDKIQFINLMKFHLKDWQVGIPNREYKLIRTLDSFFDQMDINNNGSLDWEELSNYVLGTDVIMFLGSDGHSISKQLKIQPKDIIIDILNVKKQQNGIIQMDKKNTAISRTTIIIDMIYIKEYNILIVSSNDRYLRGYRYISNGFIQAYFPKSNELFEKVIQKTEVSCLKWDEHKKILCCGLDNGNILLWDLASEFEETNNFNNLSNNNQSSQNNSNSKQNTLQQIQTSIQDLSINNKNLKQNKIYVEPQNNIQKELLFAKNKQYILEGGHKAVIQDIVPMPKLHCLATAGLDGNIVLWETINYKKKRIYTEHNRGIISLAFNPQTILLFSAGFDHWIGVWNPYTDHLINKITGYLAPIYKLEVILSHQQLVSLDCEGNILIRDLNKFNVNQSIQLEHPDEKHRFEAQTFCTVKNPLKLYFAGNNLQMYQYDVNFNPTHTDDNYPLNCLAVNQQLLLYTPCGNIIKVWSLLTGQLTKLFTGLTNKQSKITAFILDKLKKRMLIGDYNGYISIFNAENGAKIKNLPKHQKTVFHILENQSAKIIVSASIDDQIYITLDNSFGENELLRVISLKDSHIKNITFYQDYKFVIVGTSIGQVAFFESVSGKYHGQSEANQFRDQITSLNMIKNLPFLISTSSSGRINFIASPPLLYKYKIVDSFQNLDSEDQFEAVGITHASFCHENKYLFITDEKLQIKLFDISNIYDNIFQNVQEPVWTIKQAHIESIISLNYEHQEKLLFTTSTDKKVKIWCSQTGKYQGSLQQNHEYIPPKQLAYRKKFTEEIYDNDGEIFEKRIDNNFMNHKESFQISESNAEEKKLYQSELLKSEENNNNNDLSIVNYQDKILQQNQNQDIKNQLKQFLHENSFNTQSQKSQNLDLSQEDNNSILDQDDISQNQLNKIKLKKIQVDSSQNTEQLNLSEMSQQNISSSIAGLDSLTTNEQENQSKIQRTQSNNYEDNISKREVLSQEAEFNPYYFLNIIHPDRKPNNLISNPDWNINIDFDNYSIKIKYGRNPIKEDINKRGIH
ncbi:WD40-repeat-containing domain [Pseudocohnilembus persalinus]|uniref:WD40-repeat-containing domain n=1 Tax=Pseudocohnilembus persalinus TaxID=266149 RepID=A0A0V0QRD1_PSEPJ|nr:WD40-repeat-containing domain [Pseudocohnilembus persalinus]|eukprot:KRX04533.1 WD40-repeat-containing domain [Pseudocohnilembus persalinus]